jgi:hypothetical protein
VRMLYWYKSTNTDAEGASSFVQLASGAPVRMLYWYKSTNTDAEGASSLEQLASGAPVRMLRFRPTSWKLQPQLQAKGAHFTCFTSAQVLALLVHT